MNNLEAIFSTVEHSENNKTFFIHKKIGIPFKRIKGGTFFMGLSAEENAAARQINITPQYNIEEMQPIREISVPDLLVALIPVLNRHVENYTGTYQWYPAYFDRLEALKYAYSAGCRLPYEAEREYFCRGGTDTLFPFGNSLPSDAELNKWLSADFQDLTVLNKNNFNLYGIFNPEWCVEKFRISLAENAPELDGSYTIRGGGAYFWPWQDEEWVWCISAMRAPSSGLENGEACLRLVYEI